MLSVIIKIEITGGESMVKKVIALIICAVVGTFILKVAEPMVINVWIARLCGFFAAGVMGLLLHKTKML